MKTKHLRLRQKRPNQRLHRGIPATSTIPLEMISLMKMMSDLLIETVTMMNSLRNTVRTSNHFVTKSHLIPERRVGTQRILAVKFVHAEAERR